MIHGCWKTVVSGGILSEQIKCFSRYQFISTIMLGLQKLVSAMKCVIPKIQELDSDKIYGIVFIEES